MYIPFITYILFFCGKIHRFWLRFYNFFNWFYKSSWVKSFDFGCDFTIVNFALLFQPEAKSRFWQSWLELLSSNVIVYFLGSLFFSHLIWTTIIFYFCILKLLLIVVSNKGKAILRVLKLEWHNVERGTMILKNSTSNTFSNI